MQDFLKIDPNFKIETNINKSDIRFYNINQPPFTIHGVVYDDGQYRRLPQAVAKTVSQGVHSLHAHTAGGRVRFQTDSPYIAIHVTMPNIRKMPHFALTGSVGFDLYVRDEIDKYAGTFVPPFDITDGYESVIELGSSRLREFTINFPLYSEVGCVYIGVSDSATLCPPAPYTLPKPIVFYGSSITQGGCASRPGNAYQSILSRRFHFDYLNLGFSGSAKGEDAIADYIKQLDMSVFVYDYDHNAPSTEHLAATHKRMFDTIRAAQPTLPIIMLSRPKYELNHAEQQRLDIIHETYRCAKDNGDEHVYLLDGPTLMRAAGGDGTVDNCHPNDLGFWSMALAVGDVLETIL